MSLPGDSATEHTPLAIYMINKYVRVKGRDITSREEISSEKKRVRRKGTKERIKAIPKTPSLIVF